LGQTIESLPPALASALRLAIDKAEVYFQLEAEIQASDGRHIEAVLSTSLLRGSQGDIAGAIVVFTDQSKAKELEREKRRAERLAAFQSMASGIAHEIKNPLVAIKTFAELLPERFTDEDFRGEFAAVAIREIDRIDDLISRLRGLATPPTPRLVALDVRGPIDETLTLLRGQLSQADIVVRTDYGDPPLILGDSAQLKQLFLNLLMNAIEAIEGNGVVVVRTSARASLERQVVQVEIQDTGCGIPDDMLGKIFEPFVTTKARGSGLGLSICRGIVDAHRAKIYARNNHENRGATVVVEFPAVGITSQESTRRVPELEPTSRT
jgi:signal transduction histidine kinase